MSKKTLKKTDELPSTTPSTKIELYSAYSIFADFAGRKDVRINWFRTDRDNPVAPYSQLIKGFEQLTEHFSVHASKHADELLTYSEAFSIQCSVGFITGEDVFLKEVNLPIDPYSENNDSGPLSHLNNRDLGKLSGYFIATEEEEFDNSFPFWGYFNLSGTEASEEILAKAHDMGQFMLEKFLKGEGFDQDISSEAISQKIGGLYDVYESWVKYAVDILTAIELKKTPYKLNVSRWANLI